MSYQLPDYSEAKEDMVAVRYRNEQNLTRTIAVKMCQNLGIINLAIELYSGMGGETRIYEPIFREVITNDLNKKAPSEYHMSAMKFIEEKFLYMNKIDLIDFDAYGCPALEIQKYFQVRGRFDAPFILTFSDGLGLWLKRTKKDKTLRDRYLVEGEINWDKIWTRHPELIDSFFHKIGARYGLKATKIMSLQTKFKNYTLGTYLFESVEN